MSQKQNQTQTQSPVANPINIPEPDPSLFSPITNGLTSTNQQMIQSHTINKIVENDLTSQIKLSDEINVKK